MYTGLGLTYNIDVKSPVVGNQRVSVSLPVEQMASDAMNAAWPILANKAREELPRIIDAELPRLGTALQTQAPRLVSALEPELKRRLPGLVQAVGPVLEEQAPKLIAAALPAVIDRAPQLASAFEPLIDRQRTKIVNDVQKTLLGVGIAIGAGIVIWSTLSR